MNAQHPLQTIRQRRAIAAYTAAQRGVDAAREAQTELERLLAAKRAGEEARAARYAASREYAMRCAERDALVRRSGDVPASETSWLTLIAGTAAVLAAWAAFGWFAVAILEVFAGLLP